MLLIIAPSGCDESGNNATRKALDTLLADLDTAVSTNSQVALEEVIIDIKKVQVTEKTNIQSKNLILATANEKLARIKFGALSTSINSIKISLHSIATKSTQIARIRGTASSFYQAGQPSIDIDMGEQIQLIAEQSKIIQNGILNESTIAIAESDEASELARNQAHSLSEEAEELFQSAEQLGIIEGHKSFKQGVRTVRKSQELSMSAEEIETKSSLLTKRMLEDSRAELEAISSILNGVNNTNDMLEQIRSSSIKNAANLRQFADNLDNELAQKMNDTIVSTDTAVSSLDEIANNIQTSIQAVNRSSGTSREARKTSASWKLGLEWLKGQVEESKLALLVGQEETISKLISNGMVTSSNKWMALGDTLRLEINRTMENAITSYKNAVDAANSLGSNGEPLSQQFNKRISILQGDEFQDTPPASDASTTMQ
jgi:uncharacterized protein (UPF0147 family)